MNSGLCYLAVPVLLFFILLPSLAEARQIRHSAGVDVAAQVSTSGDMPFWFRTGQKGLLVDAGQGEFYRLRYHLIFRQPTESWYMTAGSELAGQVFHNPQFFFSQLFVEAGSNEFRIRIGRYPWRTGSHHETLSSGSVGESGNAMPIPKIEISTIRYIPLPYTSGYISFQGHIAHGWLNDFRYTRSPLLHEKSFYLKLSLPGNTGFQAYGGLVHYAIWGGESIRYGQLPVSIADFTRVFIALGGDEDAPPGEKNYVLGDHLGFWDAGLEGRLGDWEFLIYRHFLMETKKGLLFNTLQDGLLGLSVNMPSAFPYLKSFIWEFLYTKFQNGSLPAGQVPGQSGRVNYYNHGIYQSGWTYYGRVIGNPLMLPYSDIPGLDGQGIANNRVVAHHAGFEGMIMDDLTYELKVTYTRNYGSFRGQDRSTAEGKMYPFRNGPRQWYFYAGSSFRFMDDPDLSVSYAIAIDSGQLFRNRLGLQVGFRLKY